LSVKALVLNSLLDALDLLHLHADLKIDRIYLNARDEFLLSRAFCRTSPEFLISAFADSECYLAVRRGVNGKIGLAAAGQCQTARGRRRYSGGRASA